MAVVNEKKKQLASGSITDTVMRPGEKTGTTNAIMRPGENNMLQREGH